MNLFLQIFLTFAKIGVMTFGGGYAMIPFLERELVDDKGWTSNEELMDYYAIAQCTPGIIAVNVATFVGKKVAGIPGAVIASLGVVAPSLIIICLIAGVLTNFADIPAIKSAFAGIRVCVCVLIFNAICKLWKNAVPDKPAMLLCCVVFLLSVFLDTSPIVFVILCAFAGIFLKKLGGCRK